MADISLHRIGELLRSVFELLWNQPDGLPSREILALIPEVTPLTQYERGYLPSTSIPRYERIIRLATIPLVRAGWLIKNNKGRWYITEEGRQACRKFTNAQELYKEALRTYEERRLSAPAVIMTVEEAEEKAWEQIQRFIQESKSDEFHRLVADLLQAMGYYVTWIAPPGKDRGQIDIIAHVDPIGAKSPRIIVQVKHKGQAITIEGLKTFLSVLGANDFGLFVSTGGFTGDARDEARKEVFSRVTILDLEMLFDLWIKHYEELGQQGRGRLPLKPVFFLSPSD